MGDHALGEQAGERLATPDLAVVVQGPGDEAGVEQVQDRVLDAADILVDRQPVVGRGLVDRLGGVRVGEAGEVPGAVDEGVEGVGLALGRAAAGRAGDVLPGRVAVQRVAGLVEGRRRRGSTTGSWSSGTGTTPQAAQWMTGIGQPQ